jgi:hypothetical protein
MSFFKTHKNLTIFFTYLVLGIIFALPAIFLINQNLAVDLNLFPEFGKFFEKVKDFQAGWQGGFGLFIERIFSLNGIFYLFHLVFGEPLGFNLFWMLLFLFGAFGGYLLAKGSFLFTIAQGQDDTEKNAQDDGVKQVSAFISGFFFGILSLYFPAAVILVFFLLFFFKFLEKISLKYGILSALFYLFLANYSLFIGITTILLFLLFLIFWIFGRLKISLIDFANHKVILVKILVLFVCFLLLFSLKYYLPLRNIESLSVNNSLFLEHSLDSGKFIQPIMSYLQLASFSMFFGIKFWIVFLIILVGLGFLIYAFYNRNKNFLISFVIFLSLLFFLFSFGPYLVFDSNLYQPKIPLPYLLLYYYFPYFNQTADLSNFLLFAFVFLILAVCFGIYYLTQNVIQRNLSLPRTTKDPIKQRGDSSPSLTLRVKIPVIFVVIFLFSIFSFWSFWKPQENLSPLSFNERGSKTIFISPNTNNLGKIFYGNSQNQGQIIVGNSLFFDNFQKQSKKIKNSYAVAMANYLPEGKKIDYASFIVPDFKTTFSSYLEKEDIKYIILDNEFLIETKGEMIKISENEWGEKKFQDLLILRKIIKFLKENTNGKWQVVGDKIIYEIGSGRKQLITIYEDENWGNPDIDQKRNERWMLQDSTLVLENDSQVFGKLQLLLKLSSSNSFKKLDLYYNDKKLNEFIVGPETKNYLVNLTNVLPGKSEVKFKVFDLSQSADLLKIEEINKQNSVLFKEIRFYEVDKIEKPSFFDEIAKNDKDAKILVLPVEVDYLKNQKNVFKYDDLMDRIKEKYINAPILNNLFFNNLDFKQILDVLNRDYYYTMGQKMFTEHNIRYIVLYKDLLSEQEFSNLAKFIIHNFEIEKVMYNDDKFVGFKIKNKDFAKQIPFEFMGNWGINAWDRRTDRFYHIAYDETRIEFVNPEEENINGRLKFKIENFQSEKRKIKVYLNEDWMDKRVLTEFEVLPMKLDEEKKIKLKLSNLRPKDNEVMFKIFDENSKEVLINKDKGVRMSDFKIERVDAPIEYKLAKEIDYCNDKFKPIFEKYNFKKEFYDGFEDEEYTRKNWDLKNWEVWFTQKEKSSGKQGLRFLNNTQGFSFFKSINGCFDKITMKIMILANKWNYGADLSIDFVKDKEKEQKFSIRNFFAEFDIKNHWSFFTPREGTYYSLNRKLDFFHHFPLRKWIELKIIWKKEGQFEIFEDKNRILKRKDFDTKMPAGIKFSLGGMNPKENIEVYFDDFRLNFE